MYNIPNFLCCKIKHLLTVEIYKRIWKRKNQLQVQRYKGANSVKIVIPEDEFTSLFKRMTKYL